MYCFTELVAPRIVIQSNTTEPINKGDTGYLVCISVGVPYPSIQWYKGDEQITNGSLTLIHEETSECNTLLFTSSILQLCSVDDEDTGTYSCFAVNKVGNASVEFEIQITSSKHFWPIQK